MPSISTPPAIPGQYPHSSGSESSASSSRSPTPTQQTNVLASQLDTRTSNTVPAQPLSQSRKDQLLAEWNNSPLRRTQVAISQNEVTERILSLIIAGGIGLIPLFQSPGAQNAVSTVSSSIAERLLLWSRRLGNASIEAVKAEQEYLYKALLTGEDVDKKISTYPEQQQKAMKELKEDIAFLLTLSSHQNWQRSRNHHYEMNDIEKIIDRLIFLAAEPSVMPEVDWEKPVSERFWGNDQWKFRDSKHHAEWTPKKEKDDIIAWCKSRDGVYGKQIESFFSDIEALLAGTLETGAQLLIPGPAGTGKTLLVNRIENLLAEFGIPSKLLRKVDLENSPENEEVENLFGPNQNVAALDATEPNEDVFGKYPAWHFSNPSKIKLLRMDDVALPKRADEQSDTILDMLDPNKRKHPLESMGGKIMDLTGTIVIATTNQTEFDPAILRRTKVAISPPMSAEEKTRTALRILDEASVAAYPEEIKKKAINRYLPYIVKLSDALGQEGGGHVDKAFKDVLNTLNQDAQAGKMSDDNFKELIANALEPMDEKKRKDAMASVTKIREPLSKAQKENKIFRTFEYE